MSLSERPQAAHRSQESVGLDGTSVLLLFPGPIYDLNDYFDLRLSVLSERFNGAAFTFARHPAVVRIGRFEVHSLQFRQSRKLQDFARGFMYLLHLANARRAMGHPFQLVVSYDPLKTGIMGWALARLLKARFVVEVNGDYSSWANYQEVPSRLLRALKRSLYLAIQRFVLKRADAVKLLYHGQVARLTKSRRHRPVHIFANLVDTRGFRDLGESPEVLIVGFPFYVKGVDLLISAFRSVSDSFPEWRLKILGWYPDPAELMHAIDGHPRIVLHPPVSRMEVARHIGKCGIFALPSRTEAMGRVLLEAMACGKPRIGAAVGGIPMVIRHGVDGFLIEPENVSELARRLSELMANASLRHRLGTAGALRASTEFSPNRYAERTWELYQTALR